MTSFKFISFLAFVLGLACSWAHGEKLFVTEPAPGRVYDAGSGLLIQWIISMGDPQVAIDSLQIDVMSGPSENGDFVYAIVASVNPENLQYEWVIPEHFTSALDYFLRFKSAGPSGTLYAYSGRFTIRGDAPLPTPSAIPIQVTSTVIASTSTRFLTTATNFSTIASGTSTRVLTSVITAGAASSYATQFAAIFVALFGCTFLL